MKESRVGGQLTNDKCRRLTNVLQMITDFNSMKNFFENNVTEIHKIFITRKKGSNKIISYFHEL